MKKLTQALLFAGVIAAPAMLVSAPVMAEEAAASPVTANVTIASEYVYRGVSQTNEKIALQGGFDYAHASGFYLGAWGSNISWLEDMGDTGSSSMELDVYAGFKGTAGDFGYDVGVLHYDYPGSNIMPDPNTGEVYIAGSYKMLSVKYSHSTTNLLGYANSEGSGYLEANAGFDMGSGFTLGLHVGHQRIKNWSAFDYTDYKISLAKDLGGGLSVTGALIDTNADDALYTNLLGTKIADQRFVLSVTKAF